ncbi:MAG: hypothetical protein Q9168_006303 [Polycauliona sp. 1 TL-2023]
MHYNLAHLAALAASLSLTSAAHLDRRAPPAFVACQAVQEIVRSLQADQADATPFCRTFISIPAVTSTKTAVSISDKDPDVETESEIQATVVTPRPIVATKTITPAAVLTHYTPSAAASAVPSTVVEKRAPPDFARKYPASALSVACSCLSVAPGTSTVTLSTLPAATVTNTVTAAVPTSTVTVTSTSTVDDGEPTVTYPALCAPSVVAMRGSAVQVFGTTQQSTISGPTSPAECCVACFNTPGCQTYQFLEEYPDSNNYRKCYVFVKTSTGTGSTPVFNAAQAELCPGGVDPGDRISQPNDGYGRSRPGPCINDAVPFL